MVSWRPSRFAGQTSVWLSPEPRSRGKASTWDALVSCSVGGKGGGWAAEPGCHLLRNQSAEILLLLGSPGGIGETVWKRCSVTLMFSSADITVRKSRLRLPS